MKIAIRIVVAIALAGLVYRCWPSDIAAVERNTRKILNAVSKNGNESLPVSAAKSLEAASYLSSNVVIRLGSPFPNVIRRSEVATLLQHARMRATRLTVKSLGSQCEKTPEGEIVMDITLDADIESNGYRDELIGNYRLIWSKSGNDWLIRHAENIEVIKHPSGDAYPF